jgi:Prenyltransferase and squalene oxidase repeat
MTHPRFRLWGGRSGPWSRALVATLMVAIALAASPSRAQAAGPERPDMVTADTEQAIENGLAYLARTQAPDGSWRANAAWGGSYPVCMTALAGLAMMAGGNTPVEGPYAPNVRKAVDFLIGSVNPTGLIARMEEESRPMHGHGFAMLTLAQAYGMERDPTRQARIKRVLEKAIQLTGKSQSQAGGWLYTPDSGGDEGSVTVTQIQGLRACRNAGIRVPKSIIDNATAYIENSANPDGGIRYRAAQDVGGSRPAITAAAVATMYNAGAYEHPVALKALDFLKKHLENAQGGRAFSGHEFYGTLYAAQAMYLSSDENWKHYFPTIRDWLIQSQDKNDGSWVGDSVGPTYGTSIALVVLQLPYARLPIFQR